MDRLRDGVLARRSRPWWMSAVGYRGGVRRPCLLSPACVESGCGGQGEGRLHRLEGGRVAAHADRGAERKGGIYISESASGN